MKKIDKDKIINKYKTADARLAVENIVYIVDKVLFCHIRGLEYPHKEIQEVAESVGNNVEFLVNKIKLS